MASCVQVGHDYQANNGFIFCRKCGDIKYIQQTTTTQSTDLSTALFGLCCPKSRLFDGVGVISSYCMGWNRGYYDVQSVLQDGGDVRVKLSQMVCPEYGGAWYVDGWSVGVSDWKQGWMDCRSAFLKVLNVKI
eukprot:TRINITY_DN23229_c0_g1_i1.p1 TRINITY_DN23229_c0_g1~~TRINITY_DN23229_c0_g1_i1.p1  ORF type:complete len:133 (+),score=27.09 TRINITY_DN23229_c0_g1_i1:1-399(+)